MYLATPIFVLKELSLFVCVCVLVRVCNYDFMFRMVKNMGYKFTRIHIHTLTDPREIILTIEILIPSNAVQFETPLETCVLLKLTTISSVTVTGHRKQRLYDVSNLTSG